MPGRLLDLKLTLIFLDWLKPLKLNLEYHVEKHKVFMQFDDIRVGSLRLPIQADFEETKMEIIPQEKNWLLIMVRAGIASVGYFEEGENIEHKVFRSYMVRKKQGKSQVKYLKTKGKSRAGSRLRLASTTLFFKDINDKVNGYLQKYHIDKIGISCSKTLWPFLFNDKNNLELDNKDPRLIKIPRHVQNPTYESLLDTNRFLTHAELTWEEEFSHLFLPFFETRENNDLEMEDW
ncbi:MAG: hypothetical protein WD431_24830 [Cyclobacteriaceae bacterium]